MRENVMGKHEKLTFHHEPPKSRKGSNGTGVYIPRSFHQSWHRLFCNMTKREIHIFIEAVMAGMDRHERWTHVKLFDLREAIKHGRIDYREFIR